MKYRGYYVTEGYTKADIDKLIRKNDIKAYIAACKIFRSHGTLEASIFQNEKAEILHDEYGYTYEELEQMEIEAYKETENPAT